MFRRSVGSILVLTVSLAVILAIAGITLYVTETSEEMALDLSRQSVTTQAQVSTKALEQYLSNAQSMTRSLAAQAAIRAAFETGDPARARERLSDYAKAYKDYWAVFIFDLSGKIVAGYNSLGQDMTGGDRADRDYVKAIVGGAPEFTSRSILKAKSAEKEMLIFGVSAAVRDASGKTVGGLGVFPRWDVFTDNFIDTLRNGKRGYAFALDEKGAIIAHGADKELLLKSLSDLPFIQQALKLKNGDMFYPWQGEEKFMAVATVPATNWTICMTTYVSEMTETARTERNVLVVVGALTVVLLVGIIVFVTRTLIVRPINAIEAFTAAIAAGDLKAELSGVFRYEFKSLASNIGSMVAELKNKLGFSQGVLESIPTPCGIVGPDFHMLWCNQQICDILEKTGKPTDHTGVRSGQFFWNDATRETLSDKAITQKARQSGTFDYTTPSGRLLHINVVTTPFYDTDGKLLGSITFWNDITEIVSKQREIAAQNERIAAAAVEAAHIADQVASASEELSAQVEQASRGADEQRRMTDETATAMEEMNATVLEVAKNASQAAGIAENTRDKARLGAGIVHEVVTAIGQIKDRAATLGRDMEGLGNQAQGIGRVLDVISDIADQTNLLALNAAIEAARAGDAGRGFAVVADEVRKLAEKTMQATKEVTEAIGAIQRSARESIAGTQAMTGAVDQGTDQARRSGEALEEIVRMAEQTSDQVRGIATASEQQSAASAEISRGTENINRIATETAQTMVQSAQAVTDLSRLAQELNTLMDSLKNG